MSTMQRVRSVRWVWGAALSVAAWGEPAAAQEPPAPVSAAPVLSAEQWRELDAYIEGAVVAFGVPGAAVALIQDGQVAHVGTYGVRGVDDPEAVSEDTRFMIGSVTKSMTTTLAAELVSQGRLGWDDAVIDYLPEFELSNPEWTPLVTLRDLFRHTSGVPRSDLWLFIERPRPRELLESVSELPALSAPGERFDYQNQLFALGGFAMLRAAEGRLFSRAAGAPAGSSGSALSRAYVRRLDRRLFGPLGMRRSTADFDVALADDDHAWPHSLEPATALPSAVPIRFERSVEPTAPAGAVWASVTDMARYFAMHLREGETVDGERLFAASEIIETHTQQTEVGAAGLGYALGWGTRSSGIGELIEYSGGTAGFEAQLVGRPDADWGVVVLMNRPGSPLFRQVLGRVVELGYGLAPLGDDVALAADAAYRAQLTGLAATLLPVADHAVAPFAGRYEHDLVVGHRGEVLTLDTVYGELEFRAVPDVDRYACTSSHLFGLPAQFSVDERGTPSFLLGLQVGADGNIVDPIVSARIDDGPLCVGRAGAR